MRLSLQCTLSHARVTTPARATGAATSSASTRVVPPVPARRARPQVEVPDVLGGGAAVGARGRQLLLGVLHDQPRRRRRRRPPARRDGAAVDADGGQAQGGRRPRCRRRRRRRRRRVERFVGRRELAGDVVGQQLAGHRRGAARGRGGEPDPPRLGEAVSLTVDVSARSPQIAANGRARARPHRNRRARPRAGPLLRRARLPRARADPRARHGEKTEKTEGDLLGDGGIIKTIGVKGDAEGGKPPVGAEVRVHYVGTLMDGEKFDLSRDRPASSSSTSGGSA